MYRSECLLVSIAEIRIQIVVEVWLKVRVTQRHIQWIRVIRHRHELRGRRLVRAAVIADPHMGIVIELVVE